MKVSMHLLEVTLNWLVSGQAGACLPAQDKQLEEALLRRSVAVPIVMSAHVKGGVTLRKELQVSG